MTPSKLDIVIYRGTTFELELLSQIKVYIYEPSIHNSIADTKRTHAENMEFYGFIYQYINFLSLYTYANLNIIKPWIRDGQNNSGPIFSLNNTDGGIELTTQSVKIIIDDASTKNIEFDSGSYKLLLTTEDGKVDGLVYGTVTVIGDK